MQNTECPDKRVESVLGEHVAERGWAAGPPEQRGPGAPEPSNAARCSRSKHGNEGWRDGTEDVLCSRARRPEQLEENAVLRREGVKVHSNEFVCAEWSPQDLQALLVCGQVGVAPTQMCTLQKPVPHLHLRVPLCNLQYITIHAWLRDTAVQCRGIPRLLLRDCRIRCPTCRRTPIYTRLGSTCPYAQYITAAAQRLIYCRIRCLTCFHTPICTGFRSMCPHAFAIKYNALEATRHCRGISRFNIAESGGPL